LFKRLATVLEMAYDVTIVVPLMVERWVVAMRTGPSAVAEEVELPKQRRAA